ncbi:hypothetical protein Rsub_03590 [Raphidocelis subcapitata]|uniref:COX assembly mitochondrial protein n=1 Tax=Raphidocelis subcapitata TaxID=307507 RepID=A0A2V0P0A1_9CHLO|nr:hypothetical protein Rsub_03590 [Raphidocelis subcapitata]|eukprot:GBF91270.1 hypothetical protein Rsub_03590 [Raphidocelis subcapitata]
MVFMSPNGGPSRCYNFWMDFVKCIQDEGSDDPPKCKPFADDYLECLHHRKYYERKMAIENEKRRQEAAAKEGGKHGHH